MTRRDLLSTTPAVLAPGLLAGMPTLVVGAGPPSDVDRPVLWPSFPRQDAVLVSEIVGKAHSDEARVKELVKSEPALVNAWWDWGFGDWESPLGAASHVGQRGIAEFLLEQGARIDIFAAAMLGFTDVVKAFVTAQPGVQRTLGPHGITLLAHAKAGGERATDTVAYLVGLGDADRGHKVAPLPEDRIGAFLGKFESEATDVRLECRMNRNRQLMVEIRRGQVEPGSRPNLHYLGDDEFFPSGVPGVRFRFTVEGGRAVSVSVSVRGTDPTLRAERVGS